MVTRLTLVINVSKRFWTNFHKEKSIFGSTKEGIILCLTFYL